MQYQIGDKVKVEYEAIVIGVLQSGEDLRLRVTQKVGSVCWEEVDIRTVTLLERGGVKVWRRG